MNNTFTQTAIGKKLLRFLSAGCLSLLTTASYAQGNGTTGPTISPVSGGYAVAGTSRYISVKAEYTSQEFSTVRNNITGTGLQFGATQNTDAALPVSQSAWVDMSNVSDPTNELFSDGRDKSTSSFSVTGSNALSMFSSTRPLAEHGFSTRGRYLMGQVKVSFSEAVDNPVVQIVGLGGSITNGSTLGFTTELELLTKDVVLSKLSGNTNLQVKGTGILNEAAKPNALSNSGAASGSVLASGRQISSLTFNVYMRGNGAGFSWENDGAYVGDRWLMGFSFNGKTSQAMPAMGKGIEPAAALPIYVTNFSVAKQDGCGVMIRWNTSTELGINGFDVEHSVDGIEFRKIASFESEGNASGDHHSYVFADANNGSNYFRIHIDNSTSQNYYTATIPLKVKCSTGSVQVQPNPTQGNLQIKGYAAGNTLSLFNMTGRQVQNQTLNGSETSIDMSDLKEGIYMLIIKNEHGEVVEQVRVQKI